MQLKEFNLTNPDRCAINRAHCNPDSSARVDTAPMLGEIPASADPHPIVLPDMLEKAHQAAELALIDAAQANLGATAVLLDPLFVMGAQRGDFEGRIGGVVMASTLG